MQKKSNKPVPPAVNIDDGKLILQPLLAGGAVGLGAAGLGALIQRGLSKKKKRPSTLDEIYKDVKAPVKMSNARDAYNKLLENIGKLLPKGMPSASYLSPTDSGAMSPTHWAARGIAPLATGAAGLGLGLGIGGKMMGDAKKRRETSSAKNEVDSARDAYFSALLNKSSAELETLYTNTKSAGKVPGERGAVGKLWNAAAGLPLAIGGGAGLLGLLHGGRLAYNAAKEDSAYAARKRALLARDRLRGLTAPRVLPDEIAAIKQMNIDESNA